jgi:hypothetical protein
MAPFTLVERDGWLYVREDQLDPQQPIKTSLYYPTGGRLSHLVQLLGSEEAAQAKIGTPLTCQASIPWQFYDSMALRYRLEHEGQTRPTWTEQEVVPEPKQRGKKRPMRWYRGAWQKWSEQKGWQWV